MAFYHLFYISLEAMEHCYYIAFAKKADRAQGAIAVRLGCYANTDQ